MNAMAARRSAVLGIWRSCFWKQGLDSVHSRMSLLMNKHSCMRLSTAEKQGSRRLFSFSVQGPLLCSKRAFVEGATFSLLYTRSLRGRH